MARHEASQPRACPHCDHIFDASKSICPCCRKRADSALVRSDLLALAPSLDTMDAYVEPERLISGPWDPLFGGGIATTSVTVFAAEAGAGKTTLCAQMSDAVARTYRRKVLFISVEMVPKEAAAYFHRIGVTEFPNIHLMSLKFDIAPISQVEALIAVLQPALVILDSVSALARGDLVAEVAMCSKAKRLATKYNAPWVIISHINKDGEVAGKQAMQHDVDTVISFHIEADGTRVLECPTKNRFGKTPVFVSFSMTEHGLVPRKLTPRPAPKIAEESEAEAGDDETEDQEEEPEETEDEAEQTGDEADETSDEDESESAPGRDDSTAELNDDDEQTESEDSGAPADDDDRVSITV